MNRDTGSGFFSGFIIGALVGATIALLYAPRPGTETQRAVKEKAFEAKDAIDRIASKTKNEVAERMQHKND